MMERLADSASPKPLLLVEDDLDEAHLVRFLLEEGGRYQVTHAQDGLRGSELARRGRWALVIADINLPGEDGLEVMWASKDAHPGVPVLAITGYTNPEYTNRAIRSGADDVLLKPLDRDELLAKVDVLTGGAARRVADPEGTGGGAPLPEEAAGLSGRTASSRGQQVLALATRTGEIEVGCAGCLLRHRAQGGRVAILALGPGDPGEEGERAKEAAKSAARELGARLYVGGLGPDEVGSSEGERLVRGAIREFAPSVAYVHSAADRSPAHRTLQELLLAGAEGIERIYAYPGSLTGPSFHPTVFVPVGDVLEAKVAAAARYRTEGGVAPPHLDDAFLRAQARYWGRYAGFAEAEPLEVLKGAADWIDGNVGVP